MSVYFRTIALSALIVIGATGCVSSLQVADIDEQVARSPVIKPISKDSFEVRTSANNIKLFYKSWNAWTRPSSVKDWEYYFVIGAASSPDWAYDEIAYVEIYQTERVDSEAIKQLREIAREQGGDALIDLHREPLIAGKKMPADVIGYRYEAIIVRRKNEN